MDRRHLILSGLAAASTATTACAARGPQAQAGYPTEPGGRQSADAAPPAYTQEEIVRAGSNFLGVTAEAVGGAIERIFRDYGDAPSGYIAGEEGAGAITVGLRYGRGLLYMKNQDRPQEAFWQGPSIGWDLGGNAARVFTLCYGLYHPDALYRRFPGVEGSAYLIGGLGVNYQQADGITLAPIRAGIGLRLGANIGYLSYSKKRNLFPF